MDSDPASCSTRPKNAGQGCADYHALVSYIPSPLGDFLTRLRSELVAGCDLVSHVSILPPRRLEGNPQQAWEQIQAHSRLCSPFDLEVANVAVFPSTSVVFLELGRGRHELVRLHDALNTRHLAYHEPFAFHPHITLAQGIAPEAVQELAELARRRWDEYPHRRSFDVNELVFVRHNGHCWVDLNRCALAAAVRIAS